MRLVPLGPEHADALTAFRRAYTDAGEEHIHGFLPRPEWSFDDTVRGFDAWSREEDLPDGWVPGTTRFLEGEGRLLGVINLRHRLAGTLFQFGGHIGYSVIPAERGKGHATRMVKEMIGYARGLGIERLLLTCDPANAASARVIEKCEGVFENEIFFQPAGHAVHRYWIEV